MVTSSGTSASLATEQSVIGAFLLNANVVDDVVAVLGEGPAVFADERHQELYGAILRLRKAGVRIDPVTLMEQLKADGKLETAGGAEYIAELGDHVSTSANAGYYAGRVLECWRKRRLAELGRNLQRTARNDGPAADIIAETEAAFEELRGDGLTVARADVSAMLDRAAPPLDCIFEGEVPVGTIGGIDAAGGRGKGMLVQMLVISAAIGRPLLPRFRPTAAMPVLWLESEDPPEEIHRRFDAIGKLYEITDKERQLLAQNLTLIAGQAFPLTKPVDGTVAPTEAYQWLVREVRRLQPRLIAIDPRSHYFGGDENSNVEVAAFMTLLQRLTGFVEAGAAVWLSHHTAKQREGEASSASGRGASAARDAQRFLYSMTPLTASEVERCGIVNTALFVKLESTKSNWTEHRPDATFLQRKAGGVFVEVDMVARKNEIEAGVLVQVAKALADIIGENTANLTVRQLTSRDEGRDIRDALRDKFGRSCTRDRIAQAIEVGAREGVLTIDEDRTKNHPRSIPRRAVKHPESIADE